MKQRISTLFYSRNDFNPSENFILDIDLLTEQLESEFEDVLSYLKHSEAEPGENVIQKLLSFCENY